MARARVQGTVIDGHSHIGAMDAWRFYDLQEPVKPTVYEFATAGDYVRHMDDLGVERALVLPNYGIPVQSQPFSLNPLVLDTVKSNDRIRGGLWVSFLPQKKEMTLEALRHAGEEGIVALKTTFLLGGNPHPGTWDEATREIAEACFAAAREHDLVFHFHTSPGGTSDLSNYIPLVERFCGIELSLQAGRTIAAKKPAQLAEVARAARDLDGAVDVTLTTGSTRGPDRGALYLAQCAEAVKAATSLPVEGQFEPPEDLSVLGRVKDRGVDSVGMHVESFDPAVLSRIAPAKARTGIDGYFRAWEHAVRLFGAGQVSTYVILGMGEDPEVTIRGCRRAIDIGVYPFVVPLRPVPGSLMADIPPPDAAYMRQMYRKVAPYLRERGLASWQVRAGCARCNACSAMAAFERPPADHAIKPGRLPAGKGAS